MKSFLKSSFIISLLLTGTTSSLKSAESFNYGSHSSKNFDPRMSASNDDFNSDNSPKPFENDNDSTRTPKDDSSSQTRANPTPSSPPQRRVQNNPIIK